MARKIKFNKFIQISKSFSHLNIFKIIIITIIIIIKVKI